MKAMLPRIQPINPLRIKSPVDDADFICEVKHDGFRALAYIEAGVCRLVSRKGIQNWGTAHAFRNLVGHIAMGAGADAFIPDYRLAPEPTSA